MFTFPIAIHWKRLYLCTNHGRIPFTTIAYLPSKRWKKQATYIVRKTSDRNNDSTATTNSVSKREKAYIKAYANYKKEPKLLFLDSSMQQNFLYNIEAISIFFEKYSFFLDPNDSQKEAISHALYQLIDIMKTDVSPEKQTPQFFDKMNGIFETLDDSFYQLLMEGK